MVELQHRSHECTLTSPEIIANGICNLCFSDEPVEFACDPCNFDLCKPCSEIPQKVSHDFHPQHPLELCVREAGGKTGYILCSGCGNMFDRSFYYECKECEIYLDISCALLNNIVTGWDAKEMLHNSHAHMLKRCRPGSNVDSSCMLCELPLSPSAICYGCVHCNRFFHERCLYLPTQVQHPVHPSHPLIRLDFTYTCGYGLRCVACKYSINGVPFGCPECNVYFHMRCLDSLLRGLMHKSHHHRLFYIGYSSGADSPCQICLSEEDIHGIYYYCVECDLQFHVECLGLPETVVKKSYHIHPLVFKVFKDENDTLECCGVCETMIHAGHHVYSCEKCDFRAHIGCILREGATPSPLYLKDLYSCSKGTKRPTNGDDYKTNKLENKLMVSDTSHNHVLTLGNIKSYVCCEICRENILDRPWECKACKFHAHDYCAKLTEPSRHQVHMKHLLTLLPSYPAWLYTYCTTCKEKIHSFNLFCRTCNFTICMNCVVKVRNILGGLHRGQKFIGTTRGSCWKKSHKVVQVMVSRSYPILACTICDERAYGKIVSCMECGEIYHARCIELGRREQLSHPLHSDHILKMELTSGSNCIACKLKITKYGFTCNICSISFHIKCIEAVSM